MIDAATTKPPAFDVIVVHSFSRFFRDQFQLEFYVRRLAKNGVRLVSITQELSDDPMSNMIRQIMALFDECQSRENAKHTLRAMKENARQGFRNGSLPPIGYRIVEAAEQHGHRTKKTLEIDPIQAETVRLIFRLAREGDGSSGPMGVKSITKQLGPSIIPQALKILARQARGRMRTESGGYRVTTSARSPSESKSMRKRFASWAPRVYCCARSSPLQAQRRRVLACPVCTEVARPTGIEPVFPP
jgi:DNA invertase Pin-like site-specific DNA recombinase